MEKEEDTRDSKPSSNGTGKTTGTVPLKEMFDAAVKVIQCLPNDGPYQPSNSSRLRFYGLYKQATEGDCSQSQPSFFNVINRSKWDAWYELIGMDKEEAMKQYIDELKNIVETMSFSGDVQNFLDTIGPFYEFVSLQGPEMAHLKESLEHPNPSVTPDYLNSKTESEKYYSGDSEPDDGGLEFPPFIQSPLSCNSLPPVSPSKTFHAREATDSEQFEPLGISRSCPVVVAGRGPSSLSSSPPAPYAGSYPVNLILQETVERLNRDVDHILARIRLLEAGYAANEQFVASATLEQRKRGSIFGISPQAFTLVLSWPFVAYFIIQLVKMWLNRRRRRFGN